MVVCLSVHSLAYAFDLSWDHISNLNFSRVTWAHLVDSSSDVVNS